jgi:hypothetical protein
LFDSPESDIFEAKRLVEGTESLNTALPAVAMIASERATNSLAQLGVNPRHFARLYATNFLAAVHEIVDHDPIEGFRLDRHRDRVMLINKQDGFRVHLNKAFSFTGKLAPAGKSATKRSAYIQGSLRSKEELLESRLFTENDLLEDDDLYVTWIQHANMQFEFMAYKPLGPGSFPNSPKASLIFPLGTKEKEFATAFSPTETDEPIFVSKSNMVEESILMKDPSQNAKKSK